MRDRIALPVLAMLLVASCAGIQAGDDGPDDDPPNRPPRFDERPIDELPMVVVVGFDDTMLFFDGLDWSEQDWSVQNVGADYQSIFGSSQMGLLVGGDPPSLIHFDGRSWLLVEPGMPAAGSIHGTGPDNLWIAYGSSVARFDGRSWAQRRLNDGVDTTLTSVWSSSPDDVYACGLEGCISVCDDLEECQPAEVCGNVLFHFDGSSWSRVEEASGGPDQYWSVWGTAWDDVYLVGSDTVRHYDGDSWAELAMPGDEPYFSSVWGMSSTDVYVTGAVTENQVGAVWHFDGESWGVTAVEGALPLYDIHGSATNGLYAVGIGGTIVRKTRTGELELMAAPTTAPLWGVWVNDQPVEGPLY